MMHDDSQISPSRDDDIPDIVEPGPWNQKVLEAKPAMDSTPLAETHTVVTPKGSRYCPFKGSGSKNHTRYSFLEPEPLQLHILRAWGL